MRTHNSNYRVQELINTAPRMPHASDAWSRLFKGVFTNDSLQNWYLEYVNGDWAMHEWSVAYFGRMFPSSIKAQKPMCEFFEKSIRDANTGLPLLAVAAQRLSEWDPDEARNAYREGYRRSATPHARRVLALAALKTGESRTTLKAWLSAGPEHAPTLALLESYCWKRPTSQ